MPRVAGPVVVLGLLAAAIVAVSRLSPAPELRSASITGYRVVYRVEDRAGPRPRVHTEVLEVRRPYDSRIEQRPGPPPGGDVTAGNVVNRDHQWQLEEEGKLQFGVVRAPGGPGRDASYSALHDAAQSRAIDEIGTGEVLGHPCRWFAYADPSPARLAPPTGHSRIETCVHPDGIVLLEVWTVSGRTARIIEAVELRRHTPSRGRFLEDKDPSSENVRQTQVPGLLQRQFAVQDVTDIEPPAIDIRPPRGWRRDRRAVVAQPGAGTQSLTETYLRRGIVVIVERGTHPTLPPSWPTREGTTIALGSLGHGRLVYFLDRVELRLVGNLGFVRVTAPSRADALTFVRALRPTREGR
jgi:hypothetical protein